MEETKVTEQITEQVAEPVKTFTQEEVNEIVSKRLEKEAKKYSGYYSADDVKNKTEELNNQIADLGNSLNVANDKAATDAQTIADLEARVKKYETDSVKIRVALENGIPYELANRLTGDTPEAIAEDAKKLAPMFKVTTVTAPLHNAEANAEVDGVVKAFYERTGLKRN